MTFNCWKLKTWRSRGWSVCAIAVLSFTAGSLITARLAHIDQVKADSNRVFELRVYHTVPGKLPALESRFRDVYSKALDKHHLQVVGYWVPEGPADWDNTFVYLVAHSSREEAKKNWGAMLADPEVQEAIKSEEADKLVEKIDRTYMRPTDFSPTK
ncbi:MAG TPA: NIPSNAP family protein [Terriglobales bacterium]|nr:NIPSNAP family protein [Terriglobales bacterium]